MRPARILLTGATGQLGRDLRRALMPVGELCVTARSVRAGSGVRQLDIGDAGALKALVEAWRPEVIVNAAAYTRVDRAEDDVVTAHAVNADAVARLGESARGQDALVLHYSTDYVFSGESDRPWLEGDPTEPVNEYGRSKLAGEQALAASGCRHLVLRTGWLYATHGSNFLLTMMRLRESQRELRVVDDQTGAPTWTRPLAALSAALIAQARALGDDWLDSRCGVYHAGAAGSCTWYGFTRRILERLGDRTEAQRLVPVTSAEFPRPAARPRYSVLDGGKLAAAFGLALPDWRLQLDAALEDLGHAPHCGDTGAGV